MNVNGQIKKGACFDSVTLLRCGMERAASPGVVNADVEMGTNFNQSVLAASGIGLSPCAGQEEVISTPHHA